MKRVFFCLFVAVMISSVRVYSQAPDQQYLRVYSLIQEADRLSDSGESKAARAKYLEADADLKKLQTSYPNWNDKVVKFRLRYIEEKVGVIPPGIEPAAIPEQKKPPVAPDERDVQNRSLQEAIQRLEGEKAVLQAKLKEAFTAQPAAADPRELARAEEKIRNVEKEKELLRVALEQTTRRASLVEPEAVAALRTDLAEATRRLTEQAETAAVLRREKEVLEGRLKQLASDAGMQTLRSENEALRKQLAANIPKREAAEPNDKIERELAEAKNALQSNTKTIASLREERGALEKSKTELEKRLASYATPKEDKAAVERIKQLEKERADLQARLKDNGSHPLRFWKRRNPASQELSSLRARLAALEAQKVPYSPEELALFKQPAIEPVSKVKPEKSPVKNLSGTEATLLAEAESAFRGRRYADAEKKYQEVLTIDGNNSSTLANLAATQLEQKKLEEAEATLKRALALGPNDAHAMTLFGIVKFRQEKFDEASENLSRAAQLDPQNAETQNYLGITLSQKGQRGPAEAALRKAIQLSPGYGSAHNNLAVIYATQQPPFVELARWHYQKALAAGHPQNSDLEKLLDRNRPADK
ncbi:MAG: tetratricopeptide repeat protein [Verrucomicrobiales bacterium]|nr:tetratricopeptide repeat protein [Verrucomicrobiales bacterium]